jgi:hypothetical protein
LAAVERFNVTVGQFAAADAHNTIAAAIAAACSTINEAALAQAFRNIWGRRWNSDGGAVEGGAQVATASCCTDNVEEAVFATHEADAATAAAARSHPPKMKHPKFRQLQLPFATPTPTQRTALSLKKHRRCCWDWNCNGASVAKVEEAATTARHAGTVNKIDAAIADAHADAHGVFAAAADTAAHSNIATATSALAKTHMGKRSTREHLGGIIRAEGKDSHKKEGTG